jgi:alpha/beta superfamily hydrolase
VPQIELEGPAGRLEALFEEPPAATPPRFAAIVCHPHPKYGGTMHTHAVYRLARAIRSRGGATLRFNFRGVGLSAGAYDGGRGEADDARAALAWISQHRPDLPRLAAGFSFGAWMALEAGCADPAVRAILCGGLALRLREAAVQAAVECATKVAVVQAERDEFGTPAEVEAALAGSAGPRRVTVLPGATHLCTEDLAGFEREAALAVDWLVEELGEAP